jgi:L-lysine 2,3-aminomutase
MKKIKISFISLLKEFSTISIDIFYLFICDGLNAKTHLEVPVIDSEEGKEGEY